MNRILLPFLLTVLAASGWAVAYWQTTQQAHQLVIDSAQKPSNEEHTLPSLAPMLQGVMPAVVNISARVDENNANNDDFNALKPLPSLGSGVIIDAANGYVVSNHHVVEGATEITVILIDDREIPATLMGSDKDTDIALLKIPAEALTAIPIADSDHVQVGDFMVAIGNPLGLRHSVTLGIVSGLGRTGIAGGYEDLIQTDAPVNSGNSGGALVNAKGQLVGINKATLSQFSGNVGIGFAIPANQATEVIQQLIEFGEVRRGRLGVRGQTLTEELAEAFGSKINSGVIVTQVSVGTAGHRAGLRRGDIIVGLNGRRVTDSQSLENAIGLTSVGNVVAININRNGKEMLLNTMLQAFVPEQIFGADLRPNLQGAMFGNAEDYRYPANYAAIVTEIETNSPAWELGLEEGDLIMGIGNNRVGSLDDLEAAILSNRNRARVQLQRGRARYYLLLP